MMISTVNKTLATATIVVAVIISLGASTSQQLELNPSSQPAVNHHNIPGHYEFEVAPKMEPPAVRRPPYPQSAQMCPGSDNPFARLSPSDTLCGDLNQGRVPLNPIGQMINDQSYPFELIKNKTLQFLARALPVLKLEYETIPKVARYLPANHLLNPTHQASPLVTDHMHQLNQRLAMVGDASSALADHFSLSQQQQQQHPSLSPVYLRRRRRSAGTEQPSGKVAAELLSNVSIVVKSAHSGRIYPSANWNESMLAANSPSAPAKDCNNPKQQQAGLVANLSQQPNNNKPSGTQAPKSAQLHQQSGHNGNNWAPSGHNMMVAETLSAPVNDNLKELSTTSVSRSHNNKPATTTVAQVASGGQLEATATAGTLATGSHHNGSGDRKLTNIDVARPRQQTQAPAKGAAENQHHHHHHASGSESRTAGGSGETASQGHEKLTLLTRTSKASGDKQHQQQLAPSSASTSVSGGASATSKASNGPSRQQDSSATARHRPPACADSANGFTSAVCQAAAALIEGDRPPVWLQLAKHLGAAYSGSSPDSPLLPGPSIWSLLGGLASAGHQDTEKSSPTGGGGQSSSVRAGASSLMSVLGPLTTLLTGGSSDVQAKTDSSRLTHRQDSSAAVSQGKEQPQTLASALGSSTMAKLALAGWVSNAIVSLVEYFVPSVFQSLTGGARSFAKRKKPFDPQEQFVDTPASMAANLKQQSQLGSGFAGGKQPPTPCPSVEEYISPTFARNYQGAWKYVVQIPHEGYFTQTIQRTSCVRQRCEFTEGICHESPRWVSLLVAEIYYPNTIFGSGGSNEPSMMSPQLQNQPQQQPQTMPVGQMTSSPSTSSIQQVAMSQPIARQQTPQQGQSFGPDPLQMTDSASVYNHNLQNAFINVANELGLDPNNVANMQHLASAYNYQLMQRTGLSNSGQQQQQPTLESRSSSPALSSLPVASFAQQQQSAVVQQPTLRANNNNNNNFNNDYIMALAEATLQSNPSMSIQELIMSLRQQTQQLGLKRKRRDTAASQQQQSHRRMQQELPNQQQLLVQHRSSNLAENVPSINDIGSAGAMANQYGKQQLGTLQINQQQQHNQVSQGPDPMQPANLVPQHQAAHQSTPQQSHLNQPMPNHNGGLPEGQTASNAADTTNSNQVECDGHDKLGCYVVRVYYDWFLVNGSCKCWKTGSTNGSGAGAGSQSSSTNSFIRRIFTG